MLAFAFDLCYTSLVHSVATEFRPWDGSVVDAHSPVRQPPLLDRVLLMWYDYKVAAATIQTFIIGGFMCHDTMCLSKLSQTRGRGSGGQDIFILKLTSGSFLKSGETIMIVPLDTFWSGMRSLVESGVLPLIGKWQNGNVKGLAITWPDLQNCTQLVLDSDSMVALQKREPPNGKQANPMGDEVYYVPDDTNFRTGVSDWIQTLLQSVP